MEANQKRCNSKPARLLSDFSDIVYTSETGTNQEFDELVKSVIESVIVSVQASDGG